MKILVIGGSGVIGTYLVKHLTNSHDISYTYYTNNVNLEGTKYLLDITNRSSVNRIINSSRPDVVILAAALTNVDQCQTNKKLAYSINVKGVENIVDECKKVNCKIVYVSTSFVFDGRKKSYDENDVPNPNTYYGITKYFGEQLVLKSKLPYLILRTDQPYCRIERWHHTNSVLRVIETLKKNSTLNEIIDWYNTPTYVPEFVSATKTLIEKKKSGIFHIVGSEYISRYEWALKTAKIFCLDKSLINPITSQSLHLPVKRPNIHLKNGKALRENIKLGFIQEGLKKMRFDNSKHN